MQFSFMFFMFWGQLKGATVATFYAQKGATVATF